MSIFSYLSEDGVGHLRKLFADKAKRRMMDGGPEEKDGVQKTVEPALPSLSDIESIVDSSSDSEDSDEEIMVERKVEKKHDQLEKEEQRKKILREFAPESGQTLAFQDFSVMSYLCAKVDSTHFSVARYERSSFVKVYDVDYSDEKWAENVRSALVGSILPLRKGVRVKSFNESIDNVAKKRFVKTSHIARLIGFLDMYTHADATGSTMYHGNSGVGKTVGMDLMKAIGQISGFFVFHFNQESLHGIFIKERPGGWQRAMLEALVADNDMETWRFCMNLPKNKTDKEGEELLKKILDKAKEPIETDKNGSANLLNQLMSRFNKVVHDPVYGRPGSRIEKRKFLFLLDDVNSAHKGSTRGTQGINRMQAVAQGLQIIKFFAAKTSELINTNATVSILAASQHFSFQKKFGSEYSAKRVEPSTTIWDIIGYHMYFVGTFVVIDPNVNETRLLYKPRYRIFALKTLFKESGLVPRSIISGISDVLSKPTSYGAVDKHAIASMCLQALTRTILGNIQVRAEEVFRTYHFDRIQPGMEFPMGIRFSKDEDKADVLESKTLLRDTTCTFFKEDLLFDIDSDKLPYFDTGIIAAHPWNGKFGFISRTARAEFASVVGTHYNTVLSVDLNKDFPGSDFEKRVLDQILIKGLDTTKCKGYLYDVAPTVGSLPPVSTPKYHFKLIFTREETCFENMFNQNQLFMWLRENFVDRQSAIFSRGTTGIEFMAFDQFVLTKQFVQGGRNKLWTYCLQDSTEGLRTTTITQNRFSLFRIQGVKVLQEFYNIALPWGVRVEIAENEDVDKKGTLKRAKYMVSYIDKKEENEAQFDIEAEIIYICLKSKCVANNQQLSYCRNKTSTDDPAAKAKRARAKRTKSNEANGEDKRAKTRRASGVHKGASTSKAVETEGTAIRARKTRTDEANGVDKRARTRANGKNKRARTSEADEPEGTARAKEETDEEEEPTNPNEPMATEHDGINVYYRDGSKRRGDMWNIWVLDRRAAESLFSYSFVDLKPLETKKRKK